MRRASCRRPASQPFRRRAGPARRASAAPSRPARCERAARRGQRASAAGRGRVVPAALSRRLFGRESIELNGADLGAARFTNVAALLAMPIFNAGRTQAINDIAESGQSEAVLRYEDAIVRALEDVENALVALDDERHAGRLLQSAAASAEAALGRAQSLYDRGQIDLLPLLDAQRARLAVRVSANDSNTQLLLDSVQLYKALGGGWQAFEPVADPAASANPKSPTSSKLRRYQRGSIVKPSLATASSSPWRSPSPSCPRAHEAAARGAFDPFAPSSCATTRRAKRTATSAPCRRATRWTRRSASAARSCSAGSTSARPCAKATCSRCSTTPTTGSPRKRRGSSSIAATAQARQAESDRQRLRRAEDRRLGQRVRRRARAERCADSARAAAEAEARKLELARNRLKYTVLRASQSGVVTRVRFEVGQVVAEGQPVVSIANEGEPEIVVDVPEDHLAAFKTARFKASLASAPEETFEVVLRELSPQAAAQTRTYRARLKPATPRPLPLGATATLVVESAGRRSAGRRRSRPRRSRKATGSRRVWVVRRAGRRAGRDRRARSRRGARIPQRRGARLGSAGRRARRHRGRAEDGAGVARRAARRRAQRPNQSRPPDEIVQPHRMGAEPPRHRALPDPRDRRGRRVRLHASSASSRIRTSRCRR